MPQRQRAGKLMLPSSDSAAGSAPEEPERAVVSLFPTPGDLPAAASLPHTAQTDASSAQPGARHRDREERTWGTGMWAGPHAEHPRGTWTELGSLLVGGTTEVHSEGVSVPRWYKEGSRARSPLMLSKVTPSPLGITKPLEILMKTMDPVPRKIGPHTQCTSLRAL